jgi:hypothetical protein
MKKLIIILVAAISSLHLSAQAVHEFSVHTGGGLSTLRYQLSSGDYSGGFGGDFGIGYTYFSVKERAVKTGKVFQEHWGIHTGIGLGFYNAKAKLNNVKTVTANLDDGDAVFNKFDLHTILSGYNETQKAVFLNIPVMASFQIEQFYVMTGIKFGIPLNGKYNSKDATLTNLAYYPELNGWLPDPNNLEKAPKFRGLGEFKGKKYDGKIDLGVSTMLSLETGMKWSLNDNLVLYTGMYFDYGLNNVVKGGNKPFINYPLNNPENFTTNSVLSSYIDSSKSSTFTDKVNVMAVGIKLRLALEK